MVVRQQIAAALLVTLYHTVWFGLIPVNTPAAVGFRSLHAALPRAAAVAATVRAG